ncbi:MAG: serine hydrolase [Clostridia bacterium]|nr:serine hydrolase [Clostridia bacterium]
MDKIYELIDSCASTKKSVLIADIDSGEVLFDYNSELVFRSASTIKTPMLIFALRRCMDGERTLDELIKITEPLSDSRIFDRGDTEASLWKILYFMVTVSDNTATNVIIRELGFDAINSYFRSIGLEKTCLRRRMLDWNAVADGLENETTNREMLSLYSALFRGELLDERYTTYAKAILADQQDKSLVLRYIDRNVTAYHKSGGLDNLVHDCGIFQVNNKNIYVGVFTDGAPDVNAKCGEQLCGAVGELLYTPCGFCYAFDGCDMPSATKDNFL